MTKLVGKYWYCTQNTHTNHSNELIRVGRTHSLPSEAPYPLTFFWGYHGALDLQNAVYYAFGAYSLLDAPAQLNIFRVDIWGDVDRSYDKAAGRHRKYLRKLRITSRRRLELLRHLSIHDFKYLDKGSRSEMKSLLAEINAHFAE